MSTVADKLAKKSTRKTGGKQVRLRLVYVDFWSAVKLSFLGAVALAIVTMVSFFLVFMVLQATNVIGQTGDFLDTLTDGAVDLESLIGLPQVMAFGAVVSILRSAARRSNQRKQPPWSSETSALGGGKP